MNKNIMDFNKFEKTMEGNIFTKIGKELATLKYDINWGNDIAIKVIEELEKNQNIKVTSRGYYNECVFYINDVRFSIDWNNAGIIESFKADGAYIPCDRKLMKKIKNLTLPKRIETTKKERNDNYEKTIQDVKNKLGLPQKSHKI